MVTNNPDFSPCPLCGNPSVYKEFAPGYKGDFFVKTHSVGCTGCGINITHQSQFKFENGKIHFIENGYEILLNKWNKRVGVPSE